jgi:hypothetical protein
MATYPTAPQAHPPPPLPSDPSISNTLANYLQQFSLWCRQGFKAKLNANVALDGILLQSYNPPTGAQPTVWLLQVNQAGNFVGTQVSLGSGDLGSRPP